MNSLFATASLGFVILWITTIVGWVANIWQLVLSINDPIGALFVLKCIGIFFFPLGAILGLFGIF